MSNHNELVYNVCALFPKQKILNYFNTITFETYLENETLENVIRMFGIDWKYLDKTDMIHPHDILIHRDKLNKIQDVNFLQLFKDYQQLYRIDFTLSISSIRIPFTRKFNTRFELFPYEWLTNYITQLCDESIYEQETVSIRDILTLNEISSDESIPFCFTLMEKYIFSTNSISGNTIKSIELIDNPFI